MNIKEVQNELSELIGSDEVIAVVLKSSGKLIGSLYLGKRDFNTLELGYVFNKKYWHQGFAKESAQAKLSKKLLMTAHTEFSPNATHATLRRGSFWKILDL